MTAPTPHADDGAPRDDVPQRGASRVRWHDRVMAAALARGAVVGVPLPDEVLRALWKRMTSEPGMRAHYDALRARERTATDAGDLSAAQLRLIGSLVFAQTETPAPQTRPTTAWAAALAACALLLWVGYEPEQAEYTPRGSGTAADARVGVVARCMDASGSHVRARAEVGPQAPSDRLRCDGLIAWSLTNLSSEAVYVAAVAVDDSGALLPVPPFARGARRVGAGTTDELVPALAPSAPLQDAVVFFAFSTDPTSVDQMARDLAGAQTRGLVSSALSRLPIAVAWQGRIEVRADADGGLGARR